MRLYWMINRIRLRKSLCIIYGIIFLNRIRYLDQSKIGLGTMIIISEHYGCHWLYPLKVIQQIKAL
jgi:hypothetical protein